MTLDINAKAQAMAGINLFPPIIRDALLNDFEFMDTFEIETERTISFQGVNTIWKQAELFETIRSFYRDEVKVIFKDSEESIWTLSSEHDNLVTSNLIMAKDKKQIKLPTHAGFSMDPQTRLDFLSEMSKRVFLSSETISAWETILAERPFNDREMETFQADFNDTPTRYQQQLAEKLRNQTMVYDDLVPLSRAYYKRLIGDYDGSESIAQYSLNTAKDIAGQLISWNQWEGFFFSLHFGAHGLLTSEIDVTALSSQQLLKAFEMTAKEGDILSKVSAIEIGLRNLKMNEAIEPVLVNLIESIIQLNSDESMDDLTSFTFLFILIYGKLSKTKLFYREPPFYVKLAALTQTSLVSKQLKHFNINSDEFADHVTHLSGQWFYLQALVDMRSEPRWSPDMASVSQMKAEFIGRITIALSLYKSDLSQQSRDKLFSNDDVSTISPLSQTLAPFLPGPLEGRISAQEDLPEYLNEIIKKQFEQEELTPHSFAALVNSSLLFHMGSEYAELAARTVKEAKYVVSNVKERDEIVAVVTGLARVCAVTGNSTLMKEVRILSRKYRQDTNIALTVEELIKISLVTCSANREELQWSVAVGEWLAELAFMDITKEEADILYSNIEVLCRLKPGLWQHCGRACAALKLYHAS